MLDTWAKLRIGGSDMAGVLDGQSVVVTGSGRGLGRAYALAMAAEGAKVVVNDRDREPAEAVADEIMAAGGTATVCAEAVGTRAAAQRVVATAVERFGGIDVMITNAGADRRGPLLDLDDDDWDFTIRTHVFGSIFCSVEAGKAMREQGRGGAIVNVTSDAFHIGVATLAPYCVSKGGTYALMVVLAAELAPLGISVNAIAPPSTRTEPMLAYADSLGTMGLTDAQVADFKATILEPEQVAPLAVFLASPEGRKLSGTVLSMTADGPTILNGPAYGQLEPELGAAVRRYCT
ncbi:MAG TPA: SDR family oxidoreductase [Acidimicrobiales bacterium]|nr:SDR family oxidoreductase [Acidimicrobiales bacterium]